MVWTSLRKTLDTRRRVALSPARHTAGEQRHYLVTLLHGVDALGSSASRVYASYEVRSTFSKTRQDKAHLE